MSGQAADICPPEIEVEEDIEIEVEIEKDIEAEEIKNESEIFTGDVQNEYSQENSATASVKTINDIYNYFEKNITHLTDEQKAELNKYTSDMEIELLRYAVKEAVDCNAKSYRYVNTILQDCKNKKIFTVSQFKARQEQYEKEKMNKDKKNNKKNWQKYEQREYDNLNSLYANKKGEK